MRALYFVCKPRSVTLWPVSRRVSGLCRLGLADPPLFFPVAKVLPQSFNGTWDSLPACVRQRPAALGSGLPFPHPPREQAAPGQFFHSSQGFRSHCTSPAAQPSPTASGPPSPSGLCWVGTPGDRPDAGCHSLCSLRWGKGAAGSGPRPHSHVFWVVLQAADEFAHWLALIAHFIHRSEQGKLVHKALVLQDAVQLPGCLGPL